MKKLLKSILDDSKSLQERSFTLLFAFALSALFVMFVVGIFVEESIVDIAILGGGFVFFFLLAFFSIRYGKVKIGAPIAGLLIILVLLPVTFFTGGGIYGGSPIWFVFCILFVSLVVDGVIKYLLLGLSIVVATICYGIAYLHPETVTEHDVEAAYVDSYISLIIVCGMMSLMVGFEIWILNREKEKSDDKTREIEALNQAQSKFFSNMSHEIRTPINTIIGLNEMILRENASEEINEDAANIQAASKMLLHLINDILDMSKIESGQMELNKSPYRTGDMLSDVVSMLWIRAKEKNLEFHIDVSPELPTELFGDEVRIKQILINVLTNAIKYTNKGSVKLSIQCERDGNGQANVIYSVSDTGMGIKKESLPYLFTAFKRVDEDQNKYIEGTGLGLSIVKQFVDLMGGKITVSSIYTKGSTFLIEIPQAIVNDEHIGEIDMEKRRMGKEGHAYVKAFEAPEAKVLAVDDTAANLLVVKKLLRETKVILETVSSGEEALKRTAEEYYHVILMDHKMPGMDGVECLHAIRTQPGGYSQESKVVALTANAGADVEEFYAKEGFDGYLTKPISGKELEDALYKLLPTELVTVTEYGEKLAEESTAWMMSHKKKTLVKITTESVADLPPQILKRYNIGLIPHMVQTQDGLFRDGIEIETDGLLSYMEKEKGYAESKSPSEREYEEFFSRQLDEANNIVHLSISSRVTNSGCPRAIEAAINFGNVTVTDTWHLSSGQGLMAVEAARLAEKGMDRDAIAEKMNELKEHVHTSFIVDSLDYLANRRQISVRVARIANAFMIHPVVCLRNGKMGVSRVYFGTRERAWEKYVSTVFRVPGKIDRRMLFITYVGMTTKDLESVRAMAEKRCKFDEVYFQKASPSIATNCGPGTFGMLFFTEY
ncbi:MAG: DegV family EDD domain-containing protein [Lachnospiraceae bacterium]|nr:DegV family EDD domain-containing protein [Lachnospiraceae bacterium]